MSDPSDISQRRSRLSPAKLALLEKRLRGKTEVGASPGAIPRLADRTVAPLSFAQQRLWFAHQWDPEITTYNRPTALWLQGELHVPSLERSLGEILRRHEVLRTIFPTVDGQPVQRVSPVAHLSLPIEDLTHLPQEERLGIARQRMIEKLRQPFALESSPLYRACLFRLDSADHLFLLITHHILFDGWSEVLFVNELCALYGSFRAKESGSLPNLPIQYADFAHWQTDQVRQETVKAQLAYWRRILERPLPILDLPSDRPRPSALTYCGATHSLVLSGSLVSRLEQVSREEGVTLFMTLLSAFKVMVSRYTGQADIIVGTPVAGRRQIETEKVIGPFVNMLALRTDLAGNPTLRQLLQRIRQTCLGAYAHQDLPFDKLVAELNPERDLSRTPVFQVLFNLENLPDRAQTAGEIQVTPMDLDTSLAMFDLTVELARRDGAIPCGFVYNTALFDEATIQRLAGHFQTLLEGIVANPGQRLSDLPLLTEGERHELLVEWNEARVDYPRDLCIHQLFEAQVQRTPESVAVVFEDKSLTYRELNRKANQLARYLQEVDVGPEALVGICMERSLELPLSVLAVLKAGGAYVPLDPESPRNRLAFMLADTNVRWLITQEHLLSHLPPLLPGTMILCLGRSGELLQGWPQCCPALSASSEEMNLVCKTSPDNLAYVVYTSGSSGRPKAVLAPHRGAVNYLAFYVGEYGLGPGDVILQLPPLSFDASVRDLIGPLTFGGEVVLPRADDMRDPAALLHLIRERHVTCLLSAVVTLLAGLVQVAAAEGAHTESLRLVLASGEPLPEDLLRKIPTALGQQVSVINQYGPTEATMISSFHRAVPGPAKGNTVPIGRPVANVQTYILDRHGNPVPMGVPGEIYIGGVGVSRGYLNRPDLTAASFLPDPFSIQPGARLYRSGDLAYRLPGGDLQFLGRADQQVKIRGNRVELGEVEALLREHPGVRQSVALVRYDTPGDSLAAPGTGSRLVAYVVPESIPGPTVTDLHNFLKERLPEYMLPSAVVFLDALPLTPRGKVDRAALPAPDHTRPELDKAFVAPRTPVEVKVADIWAKVLKLEQVGVHDNFFELGGHSLLATQAISRVRDAFHIEIPLRSLFERPTVAGLAKYIEVLRTLAQDQPVESVPRIMGRLRGRL